MCETAAMNGFATGRLFEPHTKYFNDKVCAESHAVFGEQKNAWIGINAIGEPWFYTNSGTELEFENWLPGQPNTDAHDCVNYVPDGYPVGTWADWDCNEQKFFICEFV